ncbi:MAG: stage II sporulation protein M [Sporolactobacillus sp.]
MKEKMNVVFMRHLTEYRSLYVFVTALFLMGIIFGAVVVNGLPYGTRSSLLQYMENFLSDLAGGRVADPPVLLQEGIGNNIQYAGLIWLLGLSVIGLPLLFVLIFVRGLFLGFTIGFLLSEMGMKGLGIAIVGVFPQNLLVIPADIFLTVAAVSCSLKIIRRLIVKISRDPLLPQGISYAGVLLAVTALQTLACVFEAYVSPALVHVLVQ